MGIKKLSMSALLAGALVGLPAAAVRAENVTTAADAEAAAQHARDLAARYSTLGGGVGYKAGLVQSAQAEAAYYDAKAVELGGAATQSQTSNPSSNPISPSEPAEPTKPSVDHAEP